MWINALAFFDSDRRLISASADRTLKVWYLEAGAELFTLRGHTDQVQTVTVYGSGTRAISGSHDGTLKIWDLLSGAEVGTLRGHQGIVGQVLEYSQELAVSTSHDHTLRLWEPRTGEALATFSADAPVSACAIAGETIVAGDALGRIHFLQVVRGERQTESA
jgi:WD40 repeat protein